MMPGLMEPRPLPRGNIPLALGTAVVVIALPVFVLAHWRLAAWGLAAGLWGAGLVLVLVLRQLPLGTGNLATSGAVAFGRMFRAVAVMVVLIVVTASDSSLGLPAVVVYALAYTTEFGSSLVAYFGGEART
jgi:hypothetical protein